MVTLKLNDRNIDKSGMFDFAITESQIKRVLTENIDFLESHNKNLTKEQYYKILELQEIIKSIK
jgi:thermostable 8-oxoguanine DNA glycosylase